MACDGAALLIERRPGKLFATCLATGFMLIVLGAVLTVVLERKIFVVGPLSTLGVTTSVYLASVWCLAAAALIVLSDRDDALGRFAAVVGRIAVVAVLLVATTLLGTATHDSASTPLLRVPAAAGHSEYLLRLGTALESDRLSVYRASGRHFELVAAAGMAAPDMRRFASEFRIEGLADKTPILVYPSRDGREGRVELPK